MAIFQNKPDKDYFQKLKWLIFFRAIFATLLLGSTIAYRLGESPSPINKPLLLLYGLTMAILVLSIIYFALFNRFKTAPFYAYIQLSIDTLIVTLIIFVTGSFHSVFSFLYLAVIICASMLLFRKGSLIMATLCSIQYGIMVDLEYYGILKPFGMPEDLMEAGYEWSYVLYKMLTTMIACFLVAFLSSILAEQERKTRESLLIMEENVKRVEKMAAIGEMAAGLAHELKNPLASLAGSIQLLKEDSSNDPEQDKLMHIILREAHRLSELVNDFMMFAKPGPGKVERIDLESVLKDIEELFENDPVCRGRMTISREYSAGVEIEMDPGHFRQIVWNLLLNAVESIDGDEGHINIRMYSSKDSHACIDISDNGIGIDSENIKLVFNPFFTTKKDGIGLGLSIVYNILMSYSGDIDVTSEPGKGTTFHLTMNQVK